MSRLSNNGLTDYELKHYAKVILSKYGELRVKDISAKLKEDYGYEVTGSRITHTIHADPAITRRPQRIPKADSVRKKGSHLSYVYGVMSKVEDTVEVSVVFRIPSLNSESGKVDLTNILLSAGLIDFRVE